MKDYFIIVFVSLLTILFNNNISAQNEIQILLINGGKQIDRDNFLKIFDELDNISYTELVQPEANNIYSSDEINKYDALVFYDFVQEINEEQKKSFIKLLQKGKGILFLHHSLVSYQQWDEYEKIIGGRYYQSVTKEDSLKFVQSTYRHDVEIPVKIVDKEHPVTKEMNDFIIHDEVYGKYKILPEVNPLLTTNHPESEKVIAWTNNYGNSKIVYLQLGHDNNAYTNQNYRQLIKQSIHWVATQE